VTAHSSIDAILEGVVRVGLAGFQVDLFVGCVVAEEALEQRGHIR